MAFGINVHSRQPDRGTGIRGTQKRIACECWFTSTGRIMPLMLKEPGNKGAAHLLSDGKPVGIKYPMILSLQCQLAVFFELCRPNNITVHRFSSRQI